MYTGFQEIFKWYTLKLEFQKDTNSQIVFLFVCQNTFKKFIFISIKVGLLLNIFFLKVLCKVFPYGFNNSKYCVSKK